MATDAIVSLETIRCVRLRDINFDTNPYLWPVLLRIDDTTLATMTGPADLVAITAPHLGSARVILKEDMEQGDTAPIPPQVGLLTTRFEDNLSTRRLVLVVALFEEEGTPTAAMNAGYLAFLEEIRLAVAEKLSDLSEAEGAELDAIIAEIKDRVGDRVRSTIFNALTPWQKVKLISGTLSLDDLVGSQFAAFGDPALVETPISFTIKSVTELGGVDLQIHEYEITGRLILKRVGLDPCKRLSDAMIAARAILEEIEDRLQKLYDDYGEAPASEKPIIQLEIDEIENVELPPAEEAFAAAVEALAKCRGRIPPTPPKDAVLTHA